MKAVSGNRWGHRDAAAILIAYRHGLRASELVALRWDDIDLATGRLHVRRAKGGATSVHPIGAKESRALRRLHRETQAPSPYVFVSERGAPLSVAGYQRMVARAGELAGFSFLIHSHMLRHFLRLQACQRWPGHPGNPALPWPPQHCVDGTLHRVGARQIQAFLEGLSFRRLANFTSRYSVDATSRGRRGPPHRSPSCS